MTLPSDELVKRLHEYQARPWQDFSVAPIFSQAADAIEALTAERDELQMESTALISEFNAMSGKAARAEVRIDELQAALRDVMRLVADEHCADGVQYPAHAHQRLGTWDDDPGNRECGLAGKPCEECARWNAASAIVQPIREQEDK